jgi:hypothetical protein
MSKRLDYTQIAPAGIKALGGVYGYVAQSSLPPRLSTWSICAFRKSTTAPTASICTRATC